MILDSETAAFMEVAKVLAPMSMIRQSSIVLIGSEEPERTMRPEVEEWFRGRIEAVRAGLARTPAWMRKKLQRFDPQLRMRWDTISGTEQWIIERLGPNTGLYHRCAVWPPQLGDGNALIDALRAGDMQRTTTDKIVEEAERKAELQRESNSNNAKNGYLEKFDAMTNRQVRDFVEVSEAIQNGETIVFQGADAEFMNRAHKEAEDREKQGIAPEYHGRPINPGARPGIRAKK